MPSDFNTSWLNITGKQSEFYLQYLQRTLQVVKYMTHPEKQYPSTIFFIGKASKNSALSILFPYNNIQRKCKRGTINLHLDSTTVNSHTPLLFCESNPDNPIPEIINTKISQEVSTLPILFDFPSYYTLLNFIYARLIFLFSDTLCIFADDLGGLEKVIQSLTAWIHIGSSSILPTVIRPRVIIVLNKNTVIATHSVLELEEFQNNLQNINQTSRTNTFASIKLLRLEGAHLSSQAKYRRLKDVLLAENDLARQARIKQQVLFSATHFQNFFWQALNHTAKSVTTKFDFLSYSRITNEISADYSTHLFTFLELGQSHFLTYDKLAYFLASSMFMDFFVPRMHSKSEFFQLYIAF